MTKALTYFSIFLLLFWLPRHLIRAEDSRGSARSEGRPNVLFVVIDDLNDWITLLDPAAPIRTPNLDSLARRGVNFTRAYAGAPSCNPSRVAVMTGMLPTTTGVYGNFSDWRNALPQAVTLSQQFMKHGYRAVGAGKIYHHVLNGRFHDPASFHSFFPLPKDPEPPRKLNRITHWVGGRGGGPTSKPFDWGPWPEKEEMTPDVQTVNWAVRFLKEVRDEPFFLAVGIFRPHAPFYAPPQYFDRYPLDKVKLPDVLKSDREDIPSGGLELLKLGKPFLFATIMAAESQRAGTYKEAVRAYQASATFADAQVGRLISALDASPYSNNTIIVVWSDNGFHLGEKQHWEKFVLWEKATHVPLLIVAPRVARPSSRCERPVSLLDLYPTLLELCKLPMRKELEGRSLLPLLQNPEQDWDRPALSTWLRGNHSLRDERWRYIRYADGTEELYDHSVDPREWRNLAGDSEFKEVIRGLARWLPREEARPAPLVPHSGNIDN